MSLQAPCVHITAEGAVQGTSSAGNEVPSQSEFMLEVSCK